MRGNIAVFEVLSLIACRERRADAGSHARATHPSLSLSLFLSLSLCLSLSLSVSLSLSLIQINDELIQISTILLHYMSMSDLLTMLTSLITDKNDHTLHGGRIMVLSIQAFMNSAECMRPLHLMFTNVHLFCLVKRPRIDESVSFVYLFTNRQRSLFVHQIWRN